MKFWNNSRYNRWTCKQLISRIQNPQPYVIDQIQEHENMVLKEPLKITKNEISYCNFLTKIKFVYNKVRHARIIKYSMLDILANWRVTE